MIIEPVACAPGTPLHGQVVEFLYREAELLDAHRYGEWLALFAADIRYEMPVQIEDDSVPGGTAHNASKFFDDDIASLTTRVKRLQTGNAWAETPPSRTRHFVCNVLVAPTPRSEEFNVQSNFMITRARTGDTHQLFSGRREDILRFKDDGKLCIARRLILIDQTVVTNTNLSIFF